jgi:hypothetical protein
MGTSLTWFDFQSVLSHTALWSEIRSQRRRRFCFHINNKSGDMKRQETTIKKTRAVCLTLWYMLMIVTAMAPGCQESENVVGISGRTVRADRVSQTSNWNRLELHGFVTIPGIYNTILEVNGTVDYEVTFLQQSLRLDMITSAKLTEIEAGTRWEVFCSTCDQLKYENQDSLTLGKHFWIEGLDMWLNVKFSVAREVLRVRAMWLALPKHPRAEDGR